MVLFFLIGWCYSFQFSDCLDYFPSFLSLLFLEHVFIFNLPSLLWGEWWVLWWGCWLLYRSHAMKCKPEAIAWFRSLNYLTYLVKTTSGSSLFSSFWRVTTAFQWHIGVVSEAAVGAAAAGTGWHQAGSRAAPTPQQAVCIHDVVPSSSKGGPGAPLQAGRFLILFLQQVCLIHSRCTWI